MKLSQTIDDLNVSINADVRADLGDRAEALERTAHAAEQLRTTIVANPGLIPSEVDAAYQSLCFALRGVSPEDMAA